MSARRTRRALALVAMVGLVSCGSDQAARTTTVDGNDRASAVETTVSGAEAPLDEISGSGTSCAQAYARSPLLAGVDVEAPRTATEALAGAVGRIDGRIVKASVVPAGTDTVEQVVDGIEQSRTRQRTDLVLTVEVVNTSSSLTDVVAGSTVTASFPFGAQVDGGPEAAELDAAVAAACSGGVSITIFPKRIERDVQPATVTASSYAVLLPVGGGRFVVLNPFVPTDAPYGVKSLEAVAATAGWDR